MSKLVHNHCRNLVVMGAVALLVGGCSGSSGTPQDEVAVRPIPSFEVTDALSRKLFASAVTMEATTRSRLPVTGTARYVGAASYVDSNTTFIPRDMKFPEYETFIISNPDYVSRVVMTANLAGNSVNGLMDSFRESDGDAGFINMTFTGNIFTTKDNTAAFEGTLAGTKEVRSGKEIQELSFSGGIKGNFLGSQGETVLGTLAVDRGFTGDQLGSVFGVFTAER